MFPKGLNVNVTTKCKKNETLKEIHVGQWGLCNVLHTDVKHGKEFPSRMLAVSLIEVGLGHFLWHFLLIGFINCGKYVLHLERHTISH